MRRLGLREFDVIPHCRSQSRRKEMQGPVASNMLAKRTVLSWIEVTDGAGLPDCLGPQDVVMLLYRTLLYHKEATN